MHPKPLLGLIQISKIFWVTNYSNTYMYFVSSNSNLVGLVWVIWFRLKNFTFKCYSLYSKILDSHIPKINFFYNVTPKIKYIATYTIRESSMSFILASLHGAQKVFFLIKWCTKSCPTHFNRWRNEHLSEYQ